MRNIDMVATTVRQVITKKLETIRPSSNAQEAAKG